jgi:hypothetical protein
VPKTVNVDPSSWLLDEALAEDFYRAVLPLGDMNRPLNSSAALMEAPPSRGPRILSACNRKPTPQDQVVIDALMELPEAHRLAIEAIWVAGMSLREAQRHTGIPKTTVARKRDEAPRLLAEILKRKMPELADKYYLDDYLD